MTWYLLDSQPFELLAEDAQNTQLRRFNSMFTKYAMVMMRIIRERVPGYEDRTMYRAYTRFLDDNYRQLSAKDNHYPTMRNSIVAEPALPQIVEPYATHLLLKDARIASDLKYRKLDNNYNFDFLKAPVDAGRNVAKASLDNAARFRDIIKRNVTVSGNPYISEAPGHFFGASVAVTGLPFSLEAGSLANGPRLKFDMLTVTTQQLLIRSRGLSKGNAISSNNPAKNRPWVTLGKLRLKYGFLQAASFFSEARFGAQRLGMKAMLKAIDSNETTLLHGNYIYTFYDESMQNLFGRIYDFLEEMQKLDVSIEWPADVQDKLFLYGMPAYRFKKSPYMAVQTLGVVFPYRSAEILHFDSPGAVMVGHNLDTGTPVIIDTLLAATNGNGMLFGVIGVGKSAFWKNFIEEKMQRRPFTLIGWDPTEMEEHRQLAERLGIPYVRLEDGAGLADILDYGPAQTRDVLTLLFELDTELSNLIFPVLEYMHEQHIPISDLEDEIAKAATSERAIAYARLKESIHANMNAYKYLFVGNPLPKGSFIYGTHSKQKHVKAEIAATYASMLKAVEYLHQVHREKPGTESIMFFEEIHRLLDHELTRRPIAKLFLEERKYGISVWGITQEVGHILGQGREDMEQAFNQCAFVISFQTNSIELLEHKANLSKRVVSELGIANQLNEVQKGKGWIKMDTKQLLFQAYIPKERLIAYNTDFRKNPLKKK